MRTTLNIDEELLAEAQRLSEAPTKTETIERGLRALIAQEAARRLGGLAGRHPTVRAVRRRRVSERS